MKRVPVHIVFVDASVLIAAARGGEDIARPALEVLDNPNNSFASSMFVRLEVLPKAPFHKRRPEVDFYRTYFSRVDRWAAPTGSIAQSAYREAVRWGLSAMDALHVACAKAVRATEIVTAERPESPLCQSRAVRVRTIRG